MSSTKKPDIKVNVIPKKSKNSDITESLKANSNFSETNQNTSISQNDLYEDFNSGNFFNKSNDVTKELDDDLNGFIIKSTRKVPEIPMVDNENLKVKENAQSSQDFEIDDNFLKKKDDNKIDDYLPELELFYKYNDKATETKTIKEDMNMLNKDNNPVNNNKNESVLFDVNNLDLSGFSNFSSSSAPKVEEVAPVVTKAEDEPNLSKKDLKRIEKEKKLEDERLAKEKELLEKTLAKEREIQNKRLEKENKSKKKDKSNESETVDDNLKAKSLKEVKNQSKALGYMLSNGEKIYRSYKYNAHSLDRIDITNKRVVCVNSGFHQMEINEVTGISAKYKRETKSSFILIGLILLLIAGGGAAITLGLVPLNFNPKLWLKIMIYIGCGIAALSGLILLFKSSRKDFFINIFTRPQEMFFAVKSHSTPKYRINDNVISVKAGKDAYLVVAELGAAILNIKEYNKRQEKKI